MSKAACNACAFYEDHSASQSTEGLCRAVPPAVLEDEKAHWPVVKANDWCGSYSVGFAAE